MAELKDVGAEGVEEVTFLSKAKERSTGGAGEARAGVEGSTRDVWKAEGRSEREKGREAGSGEEFVKSIPGVKVVVDESFETPSIGFVTGEEENFEIASVRGGVTRAESSRSTGMEADLVTIHPHASNSVDESRGSHVVG